MWLCEELRCSTSAHLHVYPCYLEQLKDRLKRKREVVRVDQDDSNSVNNSAALMELDSEDKENQPPDQHSTRDTFMVDVSNMHKPTRSELLEEETHRRHYFFLLTSQTQQEEVTRSYLSSKVRHITGCKNLTDAASRSSIPLTTTHGGHALIPIAIFFLSSNSTPKLIDYLPLFGSSPRMKFNSVVVSVR